MRVLLLGPYPPPHGGVQTNLVAIREYLLRNGVPCSVINITRHRKPDADDVYYQTCLSVAREMAAIVVARDQSAFDELLSRPCGLVALSPVTRAAGSTRRRRTA